MNTYTKLQKYISFLLIFSILFSFSINVSFFSFVWKIFAQDTTTYNIVSIFVQEDIYSSIRSQVQTYARDIQWVLENTKTIIIPTPSDEHPFNIASLNEKLYFEWYKDLNWLTWESKLVWSVFVWNLPLPVVENEWSFQKTVFPYVDFQDKVYIYNQDKKRYSLNSSFKWDPKAEIWHWFISPNTQDKDEDIKQIKDYFSKNHDYYEWKWLFKNENWVTNWLYNQELASNYEPYVFYYDQLRESQALKYVDYKAYEQYLENIEDINYNRFSKELASKLSQTYVDTQSSYIWDYTSLFWTWLNLSNFNNKLSTNNVPDIQTRYIVNNSVKRFLQIFNSSTLWEFRKDVHNAWRYNSWSNSVWVDLIPTIVSKLDLFNESVIRNANNDLEKKIDELVWSWLSRYIAIPTTFKVWSSTYTNFFYWTQASNITNASQCSIYRWSTYNSWTLVEAHRWFNISIIDEDLALCKKAETMWYFWGYSPLNMVSFTWWTLWQLKSKNPSNAIVPLFDIKWAIKDNNDGNIPRPDDCYQDNLLLTKYNWIFWNSITVPINWASAENWNCKTVNQQFTKTSSFEQIYKNFSTLSNWDECVEQNLNLWNSVINSSATYCNINNKDLKINNYNFKKINSYITHKSPTSDEIWAQVQYMTSPNLPVDKDRYIDFIAADNTYGKINYPYLFRIWAWAKSLEETKSILKTYLDNKSKEINDLINAKNPSKLTWSDLSIYNVLKTWNYPTANIDLYDFLSKKSSQEIEIDWDKKDLSYLDTLVFSIYWTSLNSVSWKYKFVFENYLSDQFLNTSNGYFLPSNRKSYEISYLWAVWDSKNMYVKLDPEDKWENPYASIMAQNQNIYNTTMLSNTDTQDDSSFKCSPPEWVPIWKWIPAVMCRLKSIMPPTISITDWKCWYSLSWDEDEDYSYYDDQYSQQDSDKNWINDYLEDEVYNWFLELTSDNWKYYYNKTWTLEASILNSNWNLISFDNLSKVKFELVKVESVLDNWKFKDTIFDKYWDNWVLKNSLQDIANAKNYVTFKDTTLKLSNWSIKSYFTTKSLDSNITFKATLQLVDDYWKVSVSKEIYQTVSVRWDLFYSTSNRLSKFNNELVLDSWVDSVLASNKDNLFIVWDNYFTTAKKNLNTLSSFSSSQEKLFLSLSNQDNKWKSYALSYPINVKIFNDQNIEIFSKSYNSLEQILSLWTFKKAWIYKVSITDSYNNSIEKEIQILPSVAKEFTLNLWTNLMEKWWTITTNTFYLNDEFKNAVSWTLYEVEASINWNSLTFADWTKTKTWKVFEWYELFQLKSTDNTWISSINFKVYSNWQPILLSTKTVQTVDKIDFNVNSLPTNIKVWLNKYNFEIQVVWVNQNTQFDSRAYLVSNWLYIKPLDSFIEIKKNKWSWSFETTKKAWEKVKLEFKIEWVKESFIKEIDILPDVALRANISLSKSKLEASTGSTTQLYVELKDRYDNIVWNDNSTNLNLEINQKYSHILKSNDLSKKVAKWKSTFTLNATEIPGTSYFKVSTSPSLSQNVVKIDWQSPFSKQILNSISWMRTSSWALTTLWSSFFSEYDLTNYRFKFSTLKSLQESENFIKLSQSLQNSLVDLFNQNNKLTLTWVWENAWKVETFYFWNKDKLNKSNYNSIYTTLLWSSYWDITIKDNLANSIIFNKNNRWLAVTSLLNEAQEYNDILNINPNWSINFNQTSQDLSHDVSTYIDISSIWDLEISFFNETFQKLVTSVYVKFKSNLLKLSSCSESDYKNCFDSSKDTIALSSLNSIYKSTLKTDWTLSFSDWTNEDILSIDKNWKITKKPYIKLEYNDSYKDFLALNIKNDSEIIWVLCINLKNSKINIIRDKSNVNSLINSSTSSLMFVYLEWRDYFYRTNYLWNSTNSDIWFTIYYNDPFSTTSYWPTKFWTFFEFWYEKFQENSWIWWSEDNKTLLSFAAWKNVWDATKDYMTFSLINVWDPVISLKPIKRKLPWTSYDRNFDTTIWKLVSKDPKNISYSVFDYNKDQIKDIAILKNDWYIELLEWTKDINNFINKWNLAYIPDYSTKWIIQTWDFSWDSYDDIFIVNKDSKPILLNNNWKDFVRIDLEKDFALKWRIMQAISFDMDKDLIDDLVIYDDSWFINIFYWSSWNNSNPKFTKKEIDNSLWIKLNSTPRNDNSLIYFDWLYQLPQDDDYSYVEDSWNLQNIINNNISALQSQTTTNTDDFNDSIVTNAIFRQLNYTPFWQSKPIDNITSYKSSILSSLPSNINSTNSDISDINSWFQDTKNAISDFIDSWYLTYSNWTSTDDYYSNYSSSNTNTTFIKSEYSESQWLRVQKTYTDTNSWILSSNDKISLNITLKNTTSSYLDDISLVENITSPFSFNVNNYAKLEINWRNITWTWIIFKDPIDPEYDFLIDSYNYNWFQNSISLAPWQELKLTLTLDVIPFDYWHIEVWLFEEGESWDDTYWDIIFKLKKEICWETYSIYRSLSQRDYQKWLKDPVCENKSLNSNLEKNVVDVDWNKIPDYIDDLIDNSSNTSKNSSFMDFQENALNSILEDSDYDWIPDNEDISPGYSNDEWFLDKLNNINDKVSDISQWIDDIVDWFSCWFGWWWCISSPLNYAPLAPWSDPTLFWFPVWDWLKVGEWIPIYAFPTIPIPFTPPVRPPNPLWAWGRFDPPTWAWVSQFRVFVTPTITWWVWTAICFWPNVWWWLPPPWLSPFVPWWNCIVAAAPLIWCKNDWSDWEIYNVWVASGWWNIYNWNCSWSSSSNNSNNVYFWTWIINDYINYKKTWQKSTNLTNTIKDTFSKVAKWESTSFDINWPLISAFDWADSMWELSVDLDPGAFKSWNYEDVVKINMTRVSPFPDFLMDWVTRQIEEIVNKLTDFPTLYVILPDLDSAFQWVSDWYKGFFDQLQDSFKKWQEKWETIEEGINSKIDSLRQEKASLNCSENTVKCWAIDFEIKKLELTKSSSINQQMSWIKAVYKFLSNLPLVAITPQKVNINVPNIDPNSIDKAINDFELTKAQWIEERDRFEDSISFWKTCSGTQAEIEKCENQNKAMAKLTVDFNNLIGSLDKNIKILNDYKKFPEELNKVIRIKEVRLEQILCNVENIQYVIWGRIWKNWKRFKAWVELYVLIKAVLKSWQLLIDVFVDYSAECQQCKNERYDLMYFIWKLISVVIPKIPVIQFPKWPDIYLDLHNIRIWLNIYLPEFNFKLRPILLPTLPNLYLPEVPNVNIELPSLPILPEIELPELPELPSVPEVRLPDLPPPPKLPKLFWALEAILEILKLITKVMCILKTSPFVPEWRAWDQIAFITERWWYLPLDFLQVSLPQFSVPFVDAIKVTTWVNLEFESEFLVEAARQLVMPVNVFTNDIVNLMNVEIMDLDFRWIVPSEIEVSSDWVDLNSMNNSSKDSQKQISLFDFAMVLATNFGKLYSYVEKESKNDVSVSEFKEILAKELSKESLYKTENSQKIASTLQASLNYSFAQEDKLINDLLKNNDEKFTTLKSIIEREITLNKKFKSEANKVLTPKKIIEISSKEDKIENYNKELSEFNIKTLKSAYDIWNPDSEVSDIKSMWQDLKTRLDSWFEIFSKDLQKSDEYFREAHSSLNTSNTTKNISWTSIDKSKTLAMWPIALQNTTATTNTTTATNQNACNVSWEYSYVYKWLYYVEKYLWKKISYRLFDYLDEVDWDEVFLEEDFDNDSDTDAIYMVWNEIYIKENLKNKKTYTHFTWSPLSLSIGDNKYFDSDEVYHEAVNNFREWVNDNSYINVSFSQPTDSKASNFRIEFYEIVDKFLNTENSNYFPQNIRKYIVDAFRDIDDITIKDDNSSYILRNNLAYIKNIWNLSWITLTTKELKDLQEDIKVNSKVIVNSNTKIYTWWSDVKITYYNYSDESNDFKYQTVTIPAYSNINFKQDIVLVSLNSPLYVELNDFITLSWNEIVKYIKRPILQWAKIETTLVSSNNSYIWIQYFDWTQNELDFSKVRYYEIYDLWTYSNDYLVRTSIENDYFYSKMLSFKNNIFSTYSNQILLSPQIYSDNNSPEIVWFSSIKIPVYQKVNIDMTQYIYEDSSIKNIKDIYIDFDLSKDSSLDSDATNDKDYYLWWKSKEFKITKNNNKVNFEVWPYEELINKTIRIYVKDTNDNIWYKDVNFNVYSPNPKIEKVESLSVVSWVLNEKLEKEPVSIYRFRWWSLSRLFDKSWTWNSLTNSTWSFDFESTKTWSWIRIYTWSWYTSILANINEETWKIDFWLNKGYDIRVYPSNDTRNTDAYPKIIVSKDWQDLYYQYLRLPDVWEVKVVEDFSWINTTWIYFKPTINNNFDYFKIPIWVPNNPWDLIIYSKSDTLKTSLVNIFKEWSININDNKFSLEYTTFGNYVVYKLIYSWSEVWRIMVIPEANYVVK